MRFREHFLLKMDAAVLWVLVGSTALAGSLSGRVVDERGHPLSGIHLQLEGQGGTANAFSDHSGEYHFESLAGGSYQLSVRDVGFDLQAEHVDVGATAEIKHEVVVRLELLEQRVVVTATRNEVSTTLLGNSVTVLSEDETEQAARIPDLLRTVTGVHVLQTGAPGAITSLYIRGGESDYSKVLLDGIPLNQPGGYTDFSNLTTAGIERVEVVRGPQSALYGSDAIAGVIQMFSKKVDQEISRPQAELSLEGGTYSMLDATGGIRGRYNRLTYSGLFSHLETENAVPNSYLNNNTITSTLGFEVTRDSSLTLLGRGEYGRAGVPG
ncbi:MAG: hypothetical protein EHM61_27635, partial [Acidobacteria bacterium]